LDDLYLATVFNDLWDFSGTDPERTPFNLQPVVYVIWDRCCWALYSSLDTATGRFSLGVGMPGSSEDVVQGFQQDFDTGIRLPGRE
jgi:hypothetical protein